MLNLLDHKELGVGVNKNRILELFWIEVLSKDSFYSLCFLLGRYGLDTAIIITDKITDSCGNAYIILYDVEKLKYIIPPYIKFPTVFNLI